MAFRASSTIPGKGYERAKSTSADLESFVKRTIQVMSGGTNADYIIGTLGYLAATRDTLNNLKGTPGIGAYAKDQENDQAYNVAAEFNALVALLDDTITWLKNVIPTDGNGYVLMFKIVGDALEPRTFTQGQINPLITKLQAIDDAVN